MKKYSIAVLVLFVLFTSLTPANAASPAGSFAGRGSGSTLVAIVAQKNGSVTAYACDGARISEWFTGALNGTAVDLKSPGGAKIIAELTSTGATGTFTPAGGSAQKFTGATTTATSGLFRGEGTFNGVQYIGGWIILPDGMTQGLVHAGGKLIPAPKITATAKTVEIPGVGELGIVHTEPW